MQAKSDAIQHFFRYVQTCLSLNFKETEPDVLVDANVWNIHFLSRVSFPETVRWQLDAESDLIALQWLGCFQ